MEREEKKRFRLAKIVAFFLLIVMSFVSVASTLCCVSVLRADIYEDGSRETLIRAFSQSLAEDVAHTMEDYITQGADSAEIEAYLDAEMIDVEIWRKNGVKPIWGNYDGFDEPILTLDVPMSFDTVREHVLLDGYYMPADQAYFCRIFVYPLFSQENRFTKVYDAVTNLYEMRNVLVLFAVGTGIVSILCLVFLVYSASQDKKQFSQTGTNKTRKKDVLLTVCGVIVIVVLAQVLRGFLRNDQILLEILVKSGAIVIAVLWGAMCMGWIWPGNRCSRKLVKDALHDSTKFAKQLGQKCDVRLQNTSLMSSTLVIFFAICILEFMCCLFFVRTEGIILWFLEKLIILLIVVYVSLCCKRLLFAGDILAQGTQEYEVDTTGMVGVLKKHGENLNSIGQGISKAVEARIKSERMKTELITNVSHDLKTPLTSIINYSRLIFEQKTENETIAEYSQVLLCQSERLKKLLEDLVEASKATTGNLDVNLAPCEVGVLLTQAVGEYQQRLEEKSLELRSDQPEQPLQIMADGRLLWRVFDNLLNNICKYAQEGSRVYLNVEQRQEQIQIIFRNMSKYPLNISPEELEERFVRGDKSRHMEGNGLGLPIAKSLVELQNGRMDILIDGDLFKVILSFKQLEEQPSDGSL